MRETIISTKKFRVDHRTGSEGPRHDPYHFDEYTVKAGDKEIVIHYGLAEWYTVDDSVPFEMYGKGNWVDPIFIEATGYTLKQLERFRERAVEAKMRGPCRVDGGKHELDSVAGYPGEYFTMCLKCKDIIATQFYESEIE